jgi:hypothetical protein
MQLYALQCSTLQRTIETTTGLLRGLNDALAERAQATGDGDAYDGTDDDDGDTGGEPRVINVGGGDGDGGGDGAGASVGGGDADADKAAPPMIRATLWRALAEIEAGVHDGMT